MTIEQKWEAWQNRNGELAELTKGQNRKTVCAVLAAEMVSVNGVEGDLIVSVSSRLPHCQWPPLRGPGDQGALDTDQVEANDNEYITAAQAQPHGQVVESV